MVLLLGVPDTAIAGCCTLKKLEIEDPARVRVCAPAATNGCAEELIDETLSPGDIREICVDTDYLLYQEFDLEENAFSPLTNATCDGGIVEL